MRNGRPKRAASDIADDVAYLDLNDLMDDEYGRRLHECFELGELDPIVENDIRTRADRHRNNAKFGETNPFRIPRLPVGDLEIGTDFRGGAVSIDAASLNAGLLICGNTGATKTNLIKRIIRRLPSSVCIWVTDLYKQEMRHLRAALLPPVNLIVIRSSNGRFNLLQADGDPRNHVSIVLDLLRRTLDLPGRAMSILCDVIDALYREFRVSENCSRGWPTLFDVYERIRAGSERNSPARDSILDRLGAFLVALTPRVGAWRRGWRPRDLAKFNIVFEMRSASEQVKSGILNYLMFSVFRNRIQNCAPNTPLDLIIAFEDAQRFFSERNTDFDLPPTAELSGVVRGAGVGMLLSCQSMSGLPRGLLANLATKVMGRLGTHADYMQLGADMGMDAAQIDYARLNLGPGIFSVQLADGPWRRPFLLHIDRENVPPIVDDAEVERGLRALDALPTEPASEFADWQRQPVITVSTTTPPAAALADLELRFLQALVDHPGEKFTDLSRRVGLSGKRAAAVRHRLVELGYIREHAVATSGRGRTAIILEPLDLALQLLGPSQARGTV